MVILKGCQIIFTFGQCQCFGGILTLTSGKTYGYSISIYGCSLPPSLKDFVVLGKIVLNYIIKYFFHSLK